MNSLTVRLVMPTRPSIARTPDEQMLGGIETCGAPVTCASRESLESFACRLVYAPADPRFFDGVTC